MEDTWKTGDLEKHMRRGGYNEDNMRRKDRRRTEEEGIKERSGDSERQHRDREREAPRERDRPRERDSTREKTKPRDPDRDKDQDRRREGTRDRAAEKDERDRERRRERERAGERDRPRDSSRTGDRDHESRERRNDRAEKDSIDKERERRRAERDRERGTERERKREEGRDGDRERDRDRTRERERDRDREHDYERRREKERHRDRERGLSSKHVKEMNHHKDDLQEKHVESKREDERRERHSEREHSRRKEGKEYQEQRRTDKEDRERRHREREEHHSREGRRHEDKPRDEERERSCRGPMEEARHRLPSDRDRRSHDQPGKSRPVEEGDGENGLVEVTPEARLHSGRDNKRREPKDAKARAGIGRNTSAAFSQVEKVEVEIERTSAEDQGDEDGAENYEEDFEDYEDDFEDESDREEDDDGEKSEEGNKEAELSPQKIKEIEEIRRAMNAENERVGSSQQRHAVEESEIRKGNSDVPESKSNQHGKFIDFVAAKHREASKKIASKQKKRSTELLRLIDLDFSVNIPLLDLPPVNEYDMYIKSFGTTNTKQAYVQCNEDDADRDVQTEEIEADDKWTQHPGDGGTVCGGPKLISEASDQSVAKMNIDSKRLAEFLLSASQVVAVLLEEDRAEMHSLRKLKSQADSLSCSDVCVQLNTKLPFLHGREVSLISFSQVQRQTLLSVHSPTTKPSAVRLDSKTVLCIWNIWEPSCPQKVLVYESEVLCCCFSPGKATLVFAGTSVGSVVVWDLREHSSLHHTLTIGDKDWTLRYPTFSTDAVLSVSGHMSSVRSVEPVPAAVVEGLRPESSLLPSHQDSPGSSFQLASLDESGVMNMWVVVELPKADQAGSQTDLGLKPGGKVKLLHSSTLITNERSSERDAVITGPLRTLLLKFFPSDSNHFFIGTDMGLVTHGTRHGLKIPPKFYRPQEEGLRPVHITAVDVSPFGEPLFLVGCADGTIRMHSVKSEQPLMEWSRSTGAEPVLSVQWALTRPAVFCVLDAASNLHMWDLLEKDYEPVTTEKVHSDRVTAMAVFGDPAKPNTLSGVSLAKQTGEIEIQYFSKRWAVPTTAEQDTLHNIMSEVF